MDTNISTRFNQTNKTLYISGHGDLFWRDTIQFGEEAEHVIIEGADIYVTNASNLFANFQLLIDITGELDSSKCKDFSYFYSCCEKLVSPIKDLDTSWGEEFDYFHNENYSLKSVVFNSTLKGFKFSKMFSDCNSLQSIEGVTIPSNVEISSLFTNSSVLDRVGCMVNSI